MKLEQLGGWSDAGIGTKFDVKRHEATYGDHSLLNQFIHKSDGNQRSML